MNQQLKFTITLLLLLGGIKLTAQILFPQSFNVIIDTNKTIKGSILPDFKFQTQKQNLMEFQNMADISIRINKKNALTLANKIEFSKYGNNVYLSGGYLYVEYKKLLEHKMIFEPFSQIHWADARGLELKYAGGINLRYRVWVKNNSGIFAGFGPFYEHETWNFNGVPSETDELLLNKPITAQKAKLGSYISLKLAASEKLNFDFSGYHQATFNHMFYQPRLASSAMARVSLTKVLGLNIVHQFIYDYNPIVPIRKDFHKIILGFSVNF